MSTENIAAQTLEHRVLEQALKRGWGQVGGDPLAFLVRCMESDSMLVEAALEWSEERMPRDAGDANLLKAILTHGGDYTDPCDG